MMKTNKNFIVATKNPDKLAEIKEILKDFPFLNVLSMEEVGVVADIEETGETFEANALLKARAVHRITGGYVMSDDSGLTIEALNGAPGIYSARFGGIDTPYDVKIRMIWKMMDETASMNRQARFISVVAVITPDGMEYVVRGECAGLIHRQMIGENGFGYDPIFYVPEYQMTTAQMLPEQKNRISHRSIALRKMVSILRTLEF
jgi:XTP/dITP diphosphohydrolase